MTKIIGINGSPRKKWNTATMLEHFIKGSASVTENVQTEIHHLFDYNYKGCVSCFACKRIGKSYGKCGVKDDITELLEKISDADGFVLASPIYFHDITAQLRGFLERLFFQYHSFEKGETSIAPKKIYSAIIYTMNITEEQMTRDKYKTNLAATERYIGYTFFSKPELLYAFNTCEFDDYSKYKASCWNESEKKEHRRVQFPLDCKAAYDAGQSMVKKIIEEQS